MLHTWVSTQNDGWFRLALDECEVPYSYISDQDVRATPDLKSKYDVIIFPPVTTSLPTLINGVRKRLLDDGSDFGGPVPFKSTELTPNLGGVDESDDIRGGLGFDGLAHLKTFVEQGGVFVPITASASLPVGLGMIEYVTIAETRQLQASGSSCAPACKTSAARSPMATMTTVALYFNQAPVFRVSLTGGGMGGRGGAGGPGGESAGRTTGRGSATDPDIPQGRPLREFEREPTLTPAERETSYRPRTARIPGRHDLAQEDVAARRRFAGRTKKTSGSAACSRAAQSSRGRPRSSTCHWAKGTSSSSATTRCGGTRRTAVSCSS